MSWRDEIRTPQQKEYYIRTYLGIDKPKSSTEYRSAYRRLDLYVTRGVEPKKEDYARVKEVAQHNSDVKEAEKDVPKTVDTNYGQQYNDPLGEDDEDEEYAEEGDEVYARVRWRLSKDRIERRVRVIISAENAGLPLAEAMEREYWGDNVGMVYDRTVLEIYKE